MFTLFTFIVRSYKKTKLTYSFVLKPIKGETKTRVFVIFSKTVFMKIYKFIEVAFM